MNIGLHTLKLYGPMDYKTKQLNKVQKHVRNAELCTSREEAQDIIRKYEKRLAKLIKAEHLAP